MIVYVGLLTIKEGKREEYIQQLLNSGMIDIFRKQKGNVYYQVARSETDENVIVVTDGWENIAAFTEHDTCKVVEEVWKSLAGEYVLETKGFVLKQ
ncbi:MAG: antibiotic biosynthesis monooxygenase [Lachnospiraceae bacterium]|nr:antibiotic biosynthesis monooxygenase [Lachnospiraceae bacterium]